VNIIQRWENKMTITERLRLEVLIREQLSKHGNEFYTELAQILTKLEFERMPPPDFPGRPNHTLKSFE